MKFVLSPEQRQFAASMDHLLTGMDTSAAARAWATGEHGPGLKIWQRLTELGVTALSVPERYGGLDATAVDLVVAFERLGYHAVPGPWVDTIAVLPALLDDEVLEGIAAGETLASVAAPPEVPYALDADVANLRVFVQANTVHVFAPTTPLPSVDPTRRLFCAEPGDRIGTADDAERAFDFGALATAAQLLGAGQWLLDSSVTYALQRQQYGREIGRYQAIKHLLADVVTQLELTRPLVYGAAVAAATPDRQRDVSAAKVAAEEAALLAARTGLQVHGAIGYTAEHPLSLRLTKVRALASAWGTSQFHRTRLLKVLP
ncbi:acyl-CoA dehydrogenase family protein [Amycolatopsis sacchari]|uniref:acyl-CoA dehydrogenase family protein n=1 Tax=Amycolatopsis sacchari TaxID=115433 RepID=UPI003D73CE7C